MTCSIDAEGLAEALVDALAGDVEAVEEFARKVGDDPIEREVAGLLVECARRARRLSNPRTIAFHAVRNGVRLYLNERCSDVRVPADLRDERGLEVALIYWALKKKRPWKAVAAFKAYKNLARRRPRRG